MGTHTDEEDAVAALSSMEDPKHGLIEAMNLIHKARNDSTNAMGDCKEEQTRCFAPAPGTCLHACLRGAQFHIAAVGQAMRQIALSNVPHFNVSDDNGERMDVTIKEVWFWRTCCPIKPNPFCSHQLNALEMFSSKSMAAQQFHEKSCGVWSIGIDPKSNATHETGMLNV